MSTQWDTLPDAQQANDPFAAAPMVELDDGVGDTLHRGLSGVSWLDRIASGSYDAFTGKTTTVRSDGATRALQGGAALTGTAGAIHAAAAAAGLTPAAAAGAAGGFMGTGLSGLAAAGPLAIAGAAGMGGGLLISHHMAGNTVGGLFGADDTGRARDASEWGTDMGLAAEDTFQRLHGIEEGGGGVLNTIGDKMGGALGGFVGYNAGTLATLVGLGAEVGGAGCDLGRDLIDMYGHG